MNVDKLEMLQQITRADHVGGADQSVEALDAFLLRFVNQGSPQLPLYSSATANLSRASLTQA